MTTATQPDAGAYGFAATFGRLPGTWPALAVTVLAGLSEGFGLAMFVPLLQVLDGGDRTGAAASLERIFALVGVPFVLPTLLATIVALVVGALAIALTRDWLLVRAKYAYVAGLRRQVIESLLVSRWSHLSRQAGGKVINQLLVECGRAASSLTFQVMMVAAAVQIAIFAIISAMLSWQLLALCVLLAAAVAGFLRPLFRRGRAIGEATNRANQDFSFHLVDYLKGARLVRVTGSEARVLDRTQALNLAVSRVMASGERILAFSYFSVQALAAAILALVIALAGIAFGLPTSVLLTFLIIAARMAPRFVQLQQHHQAYAVYAPAVPTVDATLAASRAAMEDRRPGGRRFVGLERELALEDVSFRYQDKAGGAVEALSLRVPRNAMVAIVGRSGAGKSTVIDLIAGLHAPGAGRVLVDGVDLAEIDLVSWRRRLGYVTQDVIVFNDSVRNNLVFAHPEATEADIRDALATAHLAPIVAALPEGLDTHLGEGGVRLSGGEKQRLALARALIGKPDLLLLDEATSALDNDSERMIQQAIESISHRVTIVVVAHRLATVRKADRIHVMERGRIVEAGTYDDLVTAGGEFSRLHAIQLA